MIKWKILRIKLREWRELIAQKEEDIKDLKRKNETEERNTLKKKNVLQRLEDLEGIIDVKDNIIKLLTERLEKMEQSLLQIDENERVEKTSNQVPCEYCEFLAKSERGLNLHMKKKDEIPKLQLNVFCKATEKYISSDRDLYRKELETEIDVLEDIVDMDIDSSNVYDYEGKFLPLKITLRTRIPAQWNDSVNFRKQIWNRINQRIAKGKITEDKEGN